MMKGDPKAKTKTKADPVVEASEDSDDDIDTMF